MQTVRRSQRLAGRKTHWHVSRVRLWMDELPRCRTLAVYILVQSENAWNMCKKFACGAFCVKPRHVVELRNDFVLLDALATGFYHRAPCAFIVNSRQYTQLASRTKFRVEFAIYNCKSVQRCRASANEHVYLAGARSINKFYDRKHNRTNYCDRLSWQQARNNTYTAFEVQVVCQQTSNIVTLFSYLT